MRGETARFAESAAREAGALLLRRFRGAGGDRVRFKGAKDLVTEADEEAERLLRARIGSRFPSDRIVAEEGGGRAEGAEAVWYVDPLDGTTNFVHRFPLFSVSVAREERGELAVGVVHVPVLEETFVAEKGGGAFLNGERIRVSGVREPIEALVATGFACVRSNRIPNGVPVFDRVVHEVQGVRRGGSAAIDLAYTAAGRFDGFWEMNLNAWDIAAGILLVREAGGVVTDFLGGNEMVRRKELVAGNRAVHAYLIDRIARTAEEEGWDLRAGD
ncbi:MAG: inositol monophosphatase [Candidatus Eisenbacteria bacterium]|nr:inositol monophosphatase [Candidatus Eisenbacteria bacterium]